MSRETAMTARHIPWRYYRIYTDPNVPCDENTTDAFAAASKAIS